MLVERNELAGRKGMLAGVRSMNMADLKDQLKVTVEMKMTLCSSLGVSLHKLELGA